MVETRQDWKVIDDGDIAKYHRWWIERPHPTKFGVLFMSEQQAKNLFLVLGKALEALEELEARKEATQ